ncbi:MAG TPA: helix-turn-helix domain-containing protein [Candidatus Acidoferrum sp.]|nr:helix-turn-helix domain-containing protein [Candidatus Acidoferrum sp.]
MPRQAQPIALRQADRLELQRWVAAHGTPQQVAQRCQIILSAAEGQQDKTIAADLQINFKTVALWRARFRSEGTDCLWEVAAGRGRKPHYSDEKIKAIINATLQARPAGATHWSCAASGDGQLRYSQTSQCSGLVEEASAFPTSLCSDQLQLVKSGGAVV